MKVIINNTEVDSTVIINGESFTVLAGQKSIPVSEAIAKQWNKMHKFLTIGDATERKVEPEVKEEKVEITKTKKK